MPVVIHLDGRVDPRYYRHLLLFAFCPVNHQRQFLARLHALAYADEIKSLAAVEPKGLGAFPFLKLAGQNPHPHEVAAVDALETPGNDSLDPQQ